MVLVLYVTFMDCYFPVLFRGVRIVLIVIFTATFLLWFSC
jgi:hypothetical protein